MRRNQYGLLLAVTMLGGCAIETAAAPRGIARQPVATAAQATSIVAVPASFAMNVKTSRECVAPMVVPPVAYEGAVKLAKHEGGNVLVVYRRGWPEFQSEGTVYGKHVRCPPDVIETLRVVGKESQP